MSIHRTIPPGPQDIFWGEIAPSEHLVQLYGNDQTFLDALEGFVLGGLQKGEAVVLIATPQHRQALGGRLQNHGIDLGAFRKEEQYISLDAGETLSSFMVGDWPDDARFRNEVTGILSRATKNKRRVRAFGEMVALLWADGRHGATVRLEHMWHQLCRSEGFPLFCAYPRSGLTQDAGESIREILNTHSQILTG